MAKISIDGKEYDSDNMSEDERARLDEVVHCERKLKELRRDIAVIQTARNAYAQSLQELLKKNVETETSGS